MNQIFIDAGPLRAFITPRDQYQQKTLQLLRYLSNQKVKLITSDYVLNEVFTGLLGVKKTGHMRIFQFNNFIFQKEAVQIIWITKEKFYRTKDIFLKVSKDKLWSFTDCASFVVMKELKIKTAFTFHV